jgi:hypothetical protein
MGGGGSFQVISTMELGDKFRASGIFASIFNYLRGMIWLTENMKSIK